MNKKYLTILFGLIVVAVSACGPAPEPTLSAADIGNTAVAAAWTEVFMTQAAMPTATPIPPTVTPLPTNTLFPTLPPLLPTSAPPTLPVATAIDPCNDVPPIEPKGTTVQVKFVNKTEGTVSLSFGLVKENAKGECGTYNFYIPRYDEPVVTVLAGCYWGFAIVDAAVTSTSRTVHNLCVEDTTKAVAIWITPETINFH